MSEEPTKYEHNQHGVERDILVTVFIYEHESTIGLDYGKVTRDLDCSFYSTCELVKRSFVIGTDATADNPDCVETFIEALKKSGVSVANFEWSVTCK